MGPELLRLTPLSMSPVARSTLEPNDGRRSFGWRLRSGERECDLLREETGDEGGESTKVADDDAIGRFSTGGT